MLMYTTIGTNHLDRMTAFYDAIFDVLGIPRIPSWTEGWATWGEPLGEGFSFCICPPFNKKPATAGNGTMFSFKASSAEEVRKFHAAGLRNGGTDEGKPGVREAYGPDFYVAYLRDPDGHKLACVCYPFSPESDKPAQQ
ncbi:VOC family protein [Cronobacter universalis]|uniref:Lactoylglutathione lyase n=1 Tax=Cronobacter universalis NCTC 9529 TaxID=1074000 RepID=A0AAC8VPJ6_9ENTR|nr:VOC family protein [Cronobacter universalis]ALB54615.1 lactoylglutathione lyase [Cronobacter universalis NCTC 9529]ELY3758891.1 VOC family protein [Cronobacter universalis]ELY6246761.1 VOC family protein [Cronobacter universalis]STD05369.1 Predicted lactoylglutathione lyase [Cronobacter universalis NCTC 9529]